MTEQKTVVVTGGTSGIGRAVAADLVARGDRVIAIGRDSTRDAPAGAGIVRADLALMRETARAADEIAAQADRLDAVVLCAGIFSTVAEWTDEGLERALALNYLSRFLLVSRLLPLLAESSPGRVVLVANAGKYPDTLDLTDLQLRGGGRGLKVAGRTQFANDVLAIELGVRTGLVVGCVYPGLVATDVFRNARGLSRPVRSAITGLHRVLAGPPAAAADTPAHLAHDLGVTSGFYGPGRRRLPVPQRLDDPRRRREIWEATERTLQPWLSRSASQ